MTPKTVRFHLGQTYLKLDIASLDELAKALARCSRGHAALFLRRPVRRIVSEKSSPVRISLRQHELGAPIR